MDFTRKKYAELLVQLKQAGYGFVTYAEYCSCVPQGRFVVMRHDVDLRPDYSLATARIEHELGIRAVYYFHFLHPLRIDSYVHGQARFL